MVQIHFQPFFIWHSSYPVFILTLPSLRFHIQNPVYVKIGSTNFRSSIGSCLQKCIEMLCEKQQCLLTAASADMLQLFIQNNNRADFQHYY
ncbi:hypothetical protein A4V01_08640 [Erysipelotrichaceae bacterium I46]|nr:hypothetical protein A4V01_08640 [Erysipelotrichaceae bacterium I46]